MELFWLNPVGASSSRQSWRSKVRPMFFMLAISLRWSLMCRPKCLADTDFRQPSSEFLVQKDRVLILPALAAMMLVWMEFPPWVREDQTGSHFKIPTQRQPVRIPLIPEEAVPLQRRSTEVTKRQRRCSITVANQRRGNMIAAVKRQRGSIAATSQWRRDSATV
ncbi:hypothetical protein B296_00031059 [Ensete ventricosum]|uniref:Uncharacterized protein n=1 Tax=Ensete ventricosum TaxID=4639 RepID=A0A426Z2Z6_ENSVE|nr:hypothetical protein B296_00031059 [Ensete ventricosum]